MRDYSKIVAWQKADALVALVHHVVEALPVDERFGLATQMERAAVSLASNIAEGAGRWSDAEFERYLSIASGSASELRYQLELVNRFWPSAEAGDAVERAREVKKMLWSLRRASQRGRT